MLGGRTALHGFLWFLGSSRNLNHHQAYDRLR